MADIQKVSNGNRFFSNPCIKKLPTDKSVEVNDSIPFGLRFQEDFPEIQKMAKENGFTFAQSPTQTPTGVDACADVDIHL